MAEQKFIRIVNWDRFQHYRDRNPPWIKLYRDLLTSQTWVTLDDAGRVLAIACMMLAAATGNRIPFDPVYVRRVAYLNQVPDFSALLSLDFLEVFTEPASNPLATCKRVASTETEAETEKNPPPLQTVAVDLELQKKSEFSQCDFDARDLRKLSDALNQIARNSSAAIGSGRQVGEKEVFESACDMAGISVKRGLEVQERGKKWPSRVEASA